MVNQLVNYHVETATQLRESETFIHFSSQKHLRSTHKKIV